MANRKICVIVRVHEPASLEPALPSPRLHSSLCSLEKPSASAISITPDEIDSTASDTLLACGHTQKGNLIYTDAKKQDTFFLYAFSMHSQLDQKINVLKLSSLSVMNALTCFWRKRGWEAMATKPSMQTSHLRATVWGPSPVPHLEVGWLLY